MGKPGYSVVFEEHGKRTDTGRVQVVDGVLVMASKRVFGQGFTIELPLSRVESVTESKDAYYRLRVTMGERDYTFLMAPKDGAKLKAEITGGRTA